MNFEKWETPIFTFPHFHISTLSLHSWHSRHHFPKHSHFIHAFHHIAHLFKLLHKSIYFTDVFSGTTSYAFATAAIYEVGIIAFVGGHGVDHGFNALEGIIADI